MLDPYEETDRLRAIEDFLEAVKHPKSKAKHELLTWYGYGDEHEGIFDPIVFDVDRANGELRESFAESNEQTVSK